MKHLRRSFLGGRIAAAVVLAAVALGVAPIAPAQAADLPPTADEQLGFSRYLPDDVDGYVSLMQMGRVVRTIGSSQAWRRFDEQPDVRQGFEALRAEVGKLPPEAIAALDFATAAAESEMTIAARPDVSKNLLALGRMALLSVGGFAPIPGDLTAAEAKKLTEKQAEWRRQWAATSATIQVPSFVAAVRFREPAKYDLLVRTVVTQGWRMLSAEWERDPSVPPEFHQVLARALTSEKIGESTLLRLRLRVGDFIPEQHLAEEFRHWLPSEAERNAAAAAVVKLTLVAHVGFIGDYLTLVVSSDDAFVRAIVDRREGRSTATLAASPGFLPIRSSVTPNTIGILYGDTTAAQRELRDSLLPLLASMADPKFLVSIDVPKEIVPVIERFGKEIAADLTGAPQKRFSVLQFEQGLRQFARWEYAEAAPAGEPLTMPDLVPASAVGFVALRDGSLDPLWKRGRMVADQVELEVRRMEKYSDSPDEKESLRRRQDKLKAVLRPIEEKIAPATRGETAVIVGPFVPFTMEGLYGLKVPEMTIPSTAVVIRTPLAAQAVEGLSELFREIRTDPDGRDITKNLPFTMEVRDVDGVEAHVVSFKSVIKGLVPHVVRLDDRLVISSSFDLTRQIRDAASGRAPSIAATPAYRAIEADLPRTARKVMYLDGVAVNRGFRALADGVFAYVETNRVLFGTNPRPQQFEVVASVKRVVGAVLDLASTFRRAHGSIVREGNADVLKESVFFEDIPTE